MTYLQRWALTVGSVWKACLSLPLKFVNWQINWQCPVVKMEFNAVCNYYNLIWNNLHYLIVCKWDFLMTMTEWIYWTLFGYTFKHAWIEVRIWQDDKILKRQRQCVCNCSMCCSTAYIIPQCIHQNVGSKGQKKLCWLSVLPDWFLADNAALNASSWIYT